MQGPLAGITVLVTRAKHQAEALSSVLRARGALPVERPLLELAPVRDEEALAVAQAAEAAARGDYDALVLTSPNAAELFASALGAQGHGLGELPLRIFALGEATAAAARQAGATRLEVAAEATSEGALALVLAALPHGAQGARVLLPQARQAREVLAAGLADAGAHVHGLPLYDTVVVEHAEPLPEPLHWVTLTSPSAVRGFLAHYALPQQARVACIGRVTREAAQKAGLPVHVAPDEPSLEAMVDALVNEERRAPSR